MQPISSGLVFSEGEVWKHERRRLTPTFHFGALNDAVGYMVTEAEAMNEKLAKTAGQPLVGKHVFMSVTLRIIIRYAFGEQFDVNWMEVRSITVSSDRLMASGRMEGGDGQLCDQFLQYQNLWKVRQVPPMGKDLPQNWRS